MSETASGITIWNGEAEIYDANRPRPPRVLRDICLRQAEISSPRLVVDLGCGTGLSTLLWADCARQVIGIEPNGDMRNQAASHLAALPTDGQVEFREGQGNATGLPAACADIVTTSQALHWMEPETTFAEIARILRPGGLFAAYDYDWPPTVGWQAELAHDALVAKFQALRAALGPDQTVHFWSKEGHLQRLQDSRQFRYVREIMLYSVEEGDAERFLALTQSCCGIGRYLRQGLISEEELGWADFARTIHALIGPQPIPWYLGYRVRIGIK